MSANTECVKKARKFQRKLKEATGLEDVEYAVFMRGTYVSTCVILIVMSFISLLYLPYFLIISYLLYVLCFCLCDYFDYLSRVI